MSHPDPLPADAPPEAVDSAEARARHARPASPPSPELVELAHAYGVATEYWDWQGGQVAVSSETVVSVLAALDVDAATDDATRRSLAAVADREWARMLPPVVVTRAGVAAPVTVHVPHGEAVTVVVRLEDGGEREVQQVEHLVEPRPVAGALVGEARFDVPVDLPLGWHVLVARTDSTTATCPLVVTPSTLALPESLGEDGPQVWGLMTQLYSVRSQASWGLGDARDLAELASWSGRELGAGFVLVNPLHAAEPVGRMEPSPYLPTSRRFFNPIYLRVEDVPEVAYLAATERALLEWQAEAVRRLNTAAGPLDRDAVWTAKRTALEAVYAVPRSRSRQAEFEDFCHREGTGLRDFATWCAFAERFGLPTSQWPAEAGSPRAPGGVDLRHELADRIDFHSWLQWVLDAQLERAQTSARAAGMPLGVMHDLAVGVHPDGADTWALGSALARGVTVGAPPDAFNQQGQDWSQPPWRPDRLAELGYAPYRDMLRTVLRHAGGLRVDHIIGLFRLWWVPAGAGPAEGTYVRYDHEALVGILALEAHRSGAVVIGEDLGTVEPWVRDHLHDRGILGTSVLWFEKDGDGPLRPEHWRRLCLATVTTHDLPPTAGYLAGEHIELRDRLGLLTREVAEERAVDAADQAAVLAMLRDLGLVGDDPTERETVEALHRLMTWTPSRLVGVSLADAVGERRTMNQPGTNDEYPNWRVPLGDGNGTPLLLEDLMRSARAASLATAVTPAPR